jgi:hypothetical protein
MQKYDVHDHINEPNILEESKNLKLSIWKTISRY